MYKFNYDVDNINNKLVNQKLEIISSESYLNFDLYLTKNKCSGSAYIGETDFGEKIYLSNAYSIFLSDNKKYRVYYDIRIFEYMIQTYERNYL